MSIDVEVQFLWIFRTLAGGEAGFGVCLSDPSNVGYLLMKLGQPLWSQACEGIDGSRRNRTRAGRHGAVDWESLYLMHELGARLKQGDCVVILLAISGGQARSSQMSNDGPQFTSRRLREYLQSSPSCHVRVTNHNSKTMGTVEHFHQRPR